MESRQDGHELERTVVLRDGTAVGLRAIRRFTFQPASIMGLHDRGLVREGMVADLMVFDLGKLGVKEDEITRDGPNGSPRRVQGATGVDYVVVGGQLVLDHGQHTGAFPGRVLRAPRR